MKTPVLCQTPIVIPWRGVRISPRLSFSKLERKRMLDMENKCIQLKQYFFFSESSFKSEAVEKVLIESAIRDKGWQSYYPMIEWPYWLWQTHFAAQLKPSHGVYFICGDKAYLSLPPFWSGTCSLGHVTPHTDLAWSNTSLPLPVYTHQKIHRAVVLTPLFLALELTAVWQELLSIDGNTRPLDLPPEKSVCRSRSNS